MTYSEPYPQSPGQNPPGYTGGGPTTPPRFVNNAFYLFLLVALTHLVGIFVTIASIPAATEQAKRAAESQGGSALSASQIDTVVQAGVILAVVIGVVSLIAFVIFDLFMRRGANWARIVLLVLTVLSLFGIAGSYGVGAVGVIAGVVATILMFLRPSSEYFRAVRDRKRGALGGGYPQTPPPAQQ
ncbi:hypothetical protein AS850_12240 [Frondihabitans sp. 762G35]|uniref:hypothetical protein n=1 Tax=Frondihabitans sp. 762G35 TaxID=1446794 RepID=UPI000D221452|nr:hypothetical protein [Frondihabitans sp. 762G35]ARC57844.1 hypothetical protein AS850_12240 [Frondihabitans sp. 762G35]